jgi:hypothetical protein
LGSLPSDSWLGISLTWDLWLGILLCLRISNIGMSLPGHPRLPVRLERCVHPGARIDFTSPTNPGNRKGSPRAQGGPKGTPRGVSGKPKLSPSEIQGKPKGYPREVQHEWTSHSPSSDPHQSTEQVKNLLPESGWLIDLRHLCEVEQAPPK